MKRPGGFWGSFKWTFLISLFFSLPGAFFTSQTREKFWATIPSFAVGWALWITLGTYFVSPWLRKLPFALSVLGTAVLYIFMIVMAFVTSICLFLAVGFGLPPWHPEVAKVFSTIADARIEVRLSVLGPSMAAALIMMLAVTFLIQISRMLGPGVLSKWLLGRYRNPREETRVFMFVDMKDSTTLAEKLGDMKFSALVQRFLGDLTEPVLKTKGEVSHYIGDEAVLSWNAGDKDSAANSVKCFFMFRDALESRRTQYERDFGLLPEFKAGAHVGSVVATQVGDIKTEIVYHGDVLNTAARIQGMCGELGASFLVSGELADRTKWPAGVRSNAAGTHRLKGKEAELELVRVERD